MSRPRTKSELASDHIEEATSHIGKAISLLGGWTKNKLPRKNRSLWIARKMIESIDARLHAANDLLIHGSKCKDSTLNGVVDVILKTDFERNYDRERKPGC